MPLARATGPEAAGLANWAPARWQGGPLEVLRRARTNAGDKAPADATLAGTLLDWYNPRTLDLLANTPINSLLVTWSVGADAAVESQQQKLVASYTRAAHQRGIVVVGLLYPGSDPGRAVASAVEAGLDGLGIEGDFADGPQFAQELRRLLRAKKSSAVVIPLGPRDWLLPDVEWPVLGTSDAVTPRIRVFSESGAVTATPSTEPWIESNSWLIRSLRAGGGERPVWLGHRIENPSAADYERAIADAAVAGGRWVLAPDDALLTGLQRGDPEAFATWRRIGSCLTFYEQHAEWRAFTPAAVLGIIQDRAARHADVAAENLNLITRRRIPYRVIERADLAPAALEGLQAVLATDLAPPTEQERKLLAAFAENGGLLVAGPSWNCATPGERDYAVEKFGAGRIAVYKQDPPDPEALSKEMPDLLGKENLPVRLFNVDSLLAQVTAGPGKNGLLVQLVNYATEPSDLITVRAAGGYRSARLFSPGAPPAELRIHKSAGRIEVTVERVAVCAALLLEK